MKKNKKHITIAIIAILIAALAFGYAYLTTTLTISGVTDIDRNNWDVYFDNIQVTAGSVTGSQVIDDAEITDDTTVEFHVNLKKPGDFYEFTVDAKNDGTIDAMIETISKKMNGVEITTLPAYLDYTVTYADDLEIAENHLLEAESLVTYKVRVEFKKNISASDLPSTAQSLTLTFGVEYVQADGNAIEAGRVVYNTNETIVTIGQPIREDLITYSSPEEALTEYGHPFFLKHIVSNNVVKKTSIGFQLNGNIYYLRGADATYNTSTSDYNPDSKSYNSNKATLDNAFGSSNCVDENFANNVIQHRCDMIFGNELFRAYANNNGGIFVEFESYVCGIFSDGRSSCAFVDD